MLLGQIAFVLGLHVDAPAYRELELLLGTLEHGDRLGIVHAHEFGVDDALELGDETLLDALVEERKSSPRCSSNVLNVNLSKPSARSASSERSAKAISGSIIQNSARCRLVLEFSARNVGPNV